MSYSKGLNTTGGANRIRFEKFSQRLQRVNVDVVHRVRSSTVALGAAVPESGKLGCFFQDELEQCKNLDSSSNFKRFYYDIRELVQSLPELLHHQAIVVEKLVFQLKNVDSTILLSFLKLVSVLAKDLQEGIAPHFDILFTTLLARVTALSRDESTQKTKTVALPPELIAKIFESLSYLVKFQLKRLCQAPKLLSVYYSDLLGHSSSFVRDLSSKCFVLVVRKLKPKQFQSHAKKLLKALSANISSARRSPLELFHALPTEIEAQPRLGDLVLPPSLQDLCDGVSALLMRACRGVRGCLHSQGGVKVQILLELLTPFSVDLLRTEVTRVLSAIAAETASSQAVTSVPAKTSGKGGRGRSPAPKKAPSRERERGPVMSELSEELREALSEWSLELSLTTVVGLTNCDVFRRLFRHLHPSNAAELWLQLSVALRSFTEIWRLSSSISDLPVAFVQNLVVSTSYLSECLIFALKHSNGRGLWDKKVRKAVAEPVITACMDAVDCWLSDQSSSALLQRIPAESDGRIRHFLCRTHVLAAELWKQFATVPECSRRMSSTLPSILTSSHPRVLNDMSSLITLSKHWLLSLPADVVQTCLLQPMIQKIASIASSATSDEVWLFALWEVLSRLRDVRECKGVTSFSTATSPAVSEGGAGAADEWEVSSNSADDSEDSDGEEDNQRVRLSAPKRPREMPTLEFSDEDIQVFFEAGRTQLTSLAQACAARVGSVLESALRFPTVGLDVSAAILACNSIRWLLQCVPDFWDELCAATATLRDQLTRLFTLGQSDMLKFIASTNKLFFAQLIRLCATFSSSESTYFDVDRLLLSTLRLVLVNANSISLLWCLNSLLEVKRLQSAQFLLTDVLSQAESEQAMEVLARVLVTPSHWIRFQGLQVLSYFPSAKLSQSLPVDSSVDGKKSSKASKDDEYIDVVGVCMQIFHIPARVDTEREFGRLFGYLEVFARGNRLPDAHLRIVCAFSLGMLNFKFMPAWEPAVKVIVACGEHATGEGIMWKLLLDFIHDYSAKSISDAGDSTDIQVDPASDDLHESTSRALSALVEADSGNLKVTASLAQSDVFLFSLSKFSLKDNLVFPDSRTDFDTVYCTSWSVLRKSPAITLKRSKQVVPIFLRFLRGQYYVHFNDDPDIPFLHYIGVLTSSVEELPVIPRPVVKRRLEMFLKVFGAVTSPKQLFEHQLLFSYYSLLLCKPDTTIAKLALECVFTYKPLFLMPYKVSINRLMDDKTIRDELVEFNPAENGEAVDKLHRVDFFPFLVRILFGKLLSKARNNKMREVNSSRRVAILAFLAQISTLELQHLFHMMLRGVVPANLLLRLTERMNSDFSLPPHHGAVSPTLLSAWYNGVEAIVSNIRPEDFRSVAWERQVGHLHLLEHVVRVVGFGMTAYVPHLFQLVVSMLTNAQDLRASAVAAQGEEVAAVDDIVVEEAGVEEDLEEDNDDEKTEKFVFSPTIKNLNQCIRVRTLCILRVTEFINQYHAVVDFSSKSSLLLDPLWPLILALPSSMAGCTRPPALLKFLFGLASHRETVGMIEGQSQLIEVVVTCIASRADHSIMALTMDIIDILLKQNNGACLLSHASLIITSFCKRFVGSDFDPLKAQLKLTDLKIQPTGSVKQELSLLCNIAEGIFSRGDVEVESTLISSLATLLLGMIRTYTTNRKVRVEEEWALNILRIFRTLLWRVSDVRSHVPFVSKLFGPPSHPQSLFNLACVRDGLTEVYETLAKHPSTLGLISQSALAIRNMTARDKRVLGSRDFDLCIPVFQGLTTPSGGSRSSSISWDALLGPGGGHSVQSASLATAAVYECFRCMYDSELLLRTSALSSLKTLVDEIVRWSIADSSQSWLDLLTSHFMAGIHAGIRQSSDIVKRGFIQLLSHVVKDGVILQTGSSIPLFSLHVDLAVLHHEDPEQDFFENISHIQLHRRIKAMNRLRAQFESTVEGGAVVFGNHPFNVSSVVNIFLPIAFHPLLSDEFTKKDHLTLIQEAASLLGAICLHLPWHQYLKIVKILLRELGKQDGEKEKLLITAMCNVFDAFHYELDGDGEADGLADCDLEAARAQAENLLKPKTLDAPSHRQPVSDEGVGRDGEEENELISDEVELHRPADKVHKAEVQEGNKSHAVARTVVNSLLPWAKQFLLKDEKDHKGGKSRTVRTQVAVALTKLVSRLQPPVVSVQKKIGYFMNLVISVIGTMKSRDTSARDSARESLSKMVLTMGISSLYPVISEMQHMLTEGYQRHVCNYSIRNILTAVLETYSPPTDCPSLPILELNDVNATKIDIVVPEFDRCVPLLMESVMEDLVGKTFDDLNASEEGASRALIRESKGSKANDILESCARNILFRPTYALQNAEDPISVSSVHALSLPLLQALEGCESAEAIGRIGEGLQKIALGLSKNPTISAPELLLYLHSTLHPFVVKIITDVHRHKKSVGKIVKQTPEELKNEEEDDLALLGADLPSYLREDSSDEEDAALYSTKKYRVKDDVTGYRAETWLPSQRNALSERRLIVEERNRERAERDKVLDGASAPKLSGRDRKRTRNHNALQGGGSDPAAVSAVRFCLSLFQSALKNNRLDGRDPGIQTMIIPFLPLLGQCLRVEGAASVVAMAMRCICSVLVWGVPVEPAFGRAVGTRMLRLMFQGGALLSTDSDLVQACIKGLTSLFQLHAQRKSSADSKSLSSSGRGDKSVSALPLREDSLRSLLQLLIVSIMEVATTYQNTAFNLIKVIVDLRIMLPEVYDLMGKLMEQIVLSHRKSVRESASTVVVNFLITYPIGDKKFDAHLKQMIANCSYEYEEGRTSALEALCVLIKQLPVNIVEDSAQLLFMPMILRIVNDKALKCRTAAGEVVAVLSRKVNVDIFGMFVDYSWKWMVASELFSSQSLSVLRAGAQVLTVLVSCRSDLFKKSNRVSQTVSLCLQSLNNLIALSSEFQDLTKAESGAAAASTSSEGGKHAKVVRRGSLMKREMATADEGRGDYGGSDEWIVIYHILQLLETLFTHLPSATDLAFTHPPPSAAYLALEIIQESLLYPHAWIRAISCRILWLYLSRRDVVLSRLSTSPDGNEVLLAKNSLYHIARKLCIVINQPNLAPAHLNVAVSSLVFVIRAMYHNPQLVMNVAATKTAGKRLADQVEDTGTEDIDSVVEEEQEGDDDNDDDDVDGDDDDAPLEDDIEVENGDEHDEPADDSIPIDADVEEEEVEDLENIDDEVDATLVDSLGGSNWVMQRLRGLGADSRGGRRMHVLQVFKCLIAAETAEFVNLHLQQMLEVALRVHQTETGPDMAALKAHKELAAEVLDSLEKKVGSNEFIKVYSSVQKKKQTSKLDFKAKLAIEAISNPRAYAQRKLAKTERKVHAVKRASSGGSSGRGRGGSRQGGRGSGRGGGGGGEAKTGRKGGRGGRR